MHTGLKGYNIMVFFQYYGQDEWLYKGKAGNEGKKFLVIFLD